MQQVTAYTVMTGAVLEDGVDVALGQALRYERQAVVYRELAAALGRQEYSKLAQECDTQAAYWRQFVERLREGSSDEQ